MNARRGLGYFTLAGVFLTVGVFSTGCVSSTCGPCKGAVAIGPPVPKELEKVSQPPYVIEPPDILLIDAIRTVPLPPYRIEPLDALFVSVTNTITGVLIQGVYTVEPEGTINLGIDYGAVRVVDLTLDEARGVVEKHLKQIVKPALQVLVGLSQFRGTQQIRGEHIVHADGTVTLGTYGSVHVADMTLDQARAAIESHLSKFLLRPEIALDVFAYNSKVYYVITDGGGNGEQVVRLPSTGRETVLDVISQINGLPAVASKRHIWVGRPVPGHPGEERTLPVDWKSITCGSSETNYQIFPGDRVYVKANILVTTDTFLARLIAPVERVFGATLLGNSTVRSFSSNRNGNNNNNNNGGF